MDRRNGKEKEERRKGKEKEILLIKPTWPP